MSSPENLSLKISAAVDSASITPMARQLKELTKIIEDLGKAATKAFGAISGGKGGNFTPTPGAGSTISQIGSKIGAAGGGGAGGIGAAVSNAANLYKAAGESSKGAFKMMEASLSDMVGRSDRDIKRLVGSLQTLEQQYNKVKDRQMATGGKIDIGEGSALGGMHEEYLKTTAQLAAARKTNANAHQQLRELNSPVDTTSTGAGGGNGGGGVGGFLGRFGIGGGGAGGGGGFGGMGGIIGGAGALVGGAAALFSGVEYGLALRNQNQMANLNYQMAAPMIGMNRQAELGQIYGGGAARIKGGDAAYGLAMVDFARSGTATKMFSKDYANFVKQKILKENPDGLLENLAIGDMGGALTAGKEYVGAGITGLVNSVTGGGSIPGLSNERGQALRQKLAKEFQANLSSQQLQQGIEAVYASNPLLNERLNSVYGNALGTMATARAGGMSGKMIKKINPSTGEQYWVDQMEDFEAKQNARGFTGADTIGIRQQVMQAAGRGNMFSNTGLVQQMGAGGFGGAAGIVGAGMQFGNSGLLGQVQGMTGSGGIDAVAAGQVFGMGAGLMTRGDFSGGGANGSGLMATLGEAGFTGMGAGSDMRRARELNSGMGLQDRLNAGGLDKLNDALNWSAAAKAAPGAPLVTTNALITMSTAEKMDALKKGIVPDKYAERGVTLGMLQTYVGQTDRTLLSRTQRGFLGNTAVGIEYDKYQAAGGFGYLKGKSKSEQDAALSRIESAFQLTSGTGVTETEGMVRLRAATAGVFGSFKGKGAWSSASTSSIYGKGARAQGGIHGAQAEALGNDEKGNANAVDQNGNPIYIDPTGAERPATQGGLISGGMGLVVPGAQAADKIRRKAQTGAGAGASAEEAVKNVSDALMQFVSALKGITGASEPLGIKAKGAR